MCDFLDLVTLCLRMDFMQDKMLSVTVVLGRHVDVN